MFSASWKEICININERISFLYSDLCDYYPEDVG